MTPIHAIRDRLLQGLDQEYNVVDMAIVVDVISQLENYVITKEALEATRLGKHINELRRKANDKQLASRAKSLVKKWRELLMPTSVSGSATPVQANSQRSKETVAAAAAQRLQQHQQQQQQQTQQLSNGHSQPSSRLTSPAVSGSSSNHRLSPGLVNSSSGAPTNNQRGDRVAVNNNHHNSSSLPSSASSSPGLSRPTTPSLGSRPVSPAVPTKTHVANKRLRKDAIGDDENSEALLSPANKKPKLLNGNNTNNTTTADNSNIEPFCDHLSGVVSNGVVAFVDQSPAKKLTTRKKKQELERERLLEEKINSAKRQASKVRTTQELVQELALRSNTPTTNNAATTPLRSSSSTNAHSNAILSETKTELMNRFFESQTTNGHSVLSPPLSSEGAPSPEDHHHRVTSEGDVNAAAGGFQRESVEDVLAQLPPIDKVAILAEINAEMQENGEDEEMDDDDDDEDIEGLIPIKKPDKPADPLSEIDQAVVVQELHSGQHEGVNGNFTHDGAFKEWHEVVSKPTIHGDLLYILPYSVID